MPRRPRCLWRPLDGERGQRHRSRSTRRSDAADRGGRLSHRSAHTRRDRRRSPRRLRQPRRVHQANDPQTCLGLGLAHRREGVERKPLHEIGARLRHDRLTTEFALQLQTQRESKMLLASTYDQSRYFKAADVHALKKLRIKDVTEEEIGAGQDKEQKLVVWFTNDPRGLTFSIVISFALVFKGRIRYLLMLRTSLPTWRPL